MKLLFLICVVGSVHAQSRYFIGLFESPLSEEHMAYPVDICVNTGVGLTGASYGVFSCSDDGTSVTYTDYEDDRKCLDSSKAIQGPTYSMHNVFPGELFSFNCNGIDSYFEAKSIIDDPTCCNGLATFTKVATGVCYQDISGNFVMTTCSATSATQFIYTDEFCDHDQFGALATPEFELYADECIILDTEFAVININTVMDRCVIDGISIAEPTFCDYNIKASRPLLHTTIPTELETTQLPQSTIPIIETTTYIPRRSRLFRLFRN